MKELKKHSKQGSRFRQITVLGFFVLGVWTMLMPACVHDPFSPIDPSPIDTTGFPIDTTPVDTMDRDTAMGIPCDPNVVYFTKDVLPILVSNCAKSGCHDVISHKEGIILNNYQNAMSSDVVKAYNPGNSDLYESITETRPEKRMPEPPNEKLTTEQIDIIGKWILQGAKDLSCDEIVGGCDTTFVSYSTFVAPVLKTYCVGCHSGGAPSGNISLNSHAAVQSLAFSGRLVGAISWANGYKPMPQGSNKLSECKINKIKAWINDGAQNN